MLYTETSQKMEKCIKMLDIAFLKITPILAIWPVLIVSLFTYFTTNLGESAFELACPMWYVQFNACIFLNLLDCCSYFSNFNHIRFPFDTKNLIGYLVAIFIQYILLFNVMVSLKCLAIFGIGTCFMLFPLTKDIKNDLKAINRNARHKKKRLKTIDQLTQFVQFHSKLMQLSKY